MTPTKSSYITQTKKTVSSLYLYTKRFMMTSLFHLMNPRANGVPITSILVLIKHYVVKLQRVFISFTTWCVHFTLTNVSFLGTHE